MTRPTKQLTLPQEAIKLRALRKKELDLKHKYEDAKADRETAELHLLQRMEGEGCEGVKAGGTNFVPVKNYYGKVNDRAAFVRWAKENDIQLIEEKERKGLVNELVRERLDNGEPMPPGVTFYVDEGISQRAA